MRTKYTMKSSGLGKGSRQRLAEVLRQTKGTVSVQQAAEALKLPPDKTAKILSRWAEQGWLSRVQRGLYIPVPLEARSPDVAPEDPWIIAERLYNPCYIGGWSAAEYWQLTEQIFRTVLVMTTRRVRERKPEIKGIRFQVRTASPDALFGTKPVWRGQVRVQVADPSRTIVDLMDDPGLGGGLRSSVDILQAYLSSQHKNRDLLVTYAERLGNKTVFKRLGFLAEQYAPAEDSLIKACRIRLSQGNSKLDPALPADRLITSWKLWVSAGWVKRGRDD
jgi:predicted transcriptional regulator of viral defense system